MTQDIRGYIHGYPQPRQAWENEGNEGRGKNGLAINWNEFSVDSARCTRREACAHWLAVASAIICRSARLLHWCGSSMNSKQHSRHAAMMCERTTCDARPRADDSSTPAPSRRASVKHPGVGQNAGHSPPGHLLSQLTPRSALSNWLCAGCLKLTTDNWVTVT